MSRGCCCRAGRRHIGCAVALLLFGGVLVAVAQTSSALAQTAPQQAAPAGDAPGQAVSGRVVSAADGHPIPNATVTLTPQRGGTGRRPGGPFGQGQTAQTDSEGRFHLPPQPAGRYSLRASAAGYLASLYLEHDGYSSAVVTGAGVSTDALRFALTPEAALHGRVLDETGEPVRASVTLYRDAADEPVTRPGFAERAPQQRIRPAGGIQADDDGRYEFPNLRPGHYYVAASATPWYAVHGRPQANEDRMAYRTSIDPALDVAYPVTFYPHATTEDGAVPIVLKAGSRATANLLMQAERAVTLTVQLPPVDPSVRDRVPTVPTLVQKVFGNDHSTGAQAVGNFRGDAAVEGRTVTLTGIAPGQYVMRSFGRGGPSSEEVPVNLSGGSANVAMRGAGQAGAAEVTIALHTSGGAAAPEGLEINLERAGPSRVSAPSAVALQGGVARFTGVEPGDYRLRLPTGGAAWNVSRLSVNGKVLPSRLLHVDGGAVVQAEVVASQYAPEIDGTVHAADGKPHAGSLVVLVPAGADSGEDLYRADQSDLDGGFQFPNVLPGNYLLVAIDNDWKLNWQSSAALLPYLTHALPVTVPVSGPRTVALQEAAVVQQR